MSHADSAATFRDALRHFHSPQQNVVFADVAGNIGFASPARVPVRRSGNGQHPVPGWSGEFDWIGFVPFEELPASSNPRSALIINANNKIVPDEFAHLIAVDWPPPSRAERIAAVLGASACSHGVKASHLDRTSVV